MCNSLDRDPISLTKNIKINQYSTIVLNKDHHHLNRRITDILLTRIFRMFPNTWDLCCTSAAASYTSAITYIINLDPSNNSFKLRVYSKVIESVQQVVQSE